MYDDVEYGRYDTSEVLLKETSFNVRKRFVQKVYSLICCQLILTAGISFLAMQTTHAGFGLFLRANPWTLWVMLGINLVTMIMVFCCRSMARTVPTNYILLTIFTVSEAWMVAFICAWYQAQGAADIVLMAVLMTAAMTFALTLYACTAKTDFTLYGGALFILGCVLLLIMIFGLFVRNPIVHVVISALVIGLYGFYLIYDTQLVIGGKTYELSIDDYVIGAIIIYIDIIVLFLRILEILNYFMNDRR